MSDEGDEAEIRELADKFGIPLHVDIPGIPTDPGIGPHDPDYFVNYLKDFRRAEQDVVDILKSMSAGERYELRTFRAPQEEFQEKHKLVFAPNWYGGGFAFAQKPDYQYWISLPYWTVCEATCLSIGFQPCEVPKIQDGLEDQNDSPLAFFWARHRFIERGCPKKKGDQGAIVPSEFVRWANQTAIFEIPEPLSTLEIELPDASPAMLKKVDRRRYHSALKIIVALEELWLGSPSNDDGKEVAEDIAKKFTQQGVRMDPRTLRGILAEAKELRPTFPK